MNPLLSSAARFWELRSRRERLELPLDDDEIREFSSIAEVVRPLTDLGRVPGAVLLSRNEGVTLIDHVTLHGGGFDVTSVGSCSLDVGDWAVLRVEDAHGGDEFAFPCVAVQRRRGWLRLGVDGAPVRVALTPRPGGFGLAWSPPRPERRPNAAR